MFSISPKELLSVIVPVYNNDKYLEECIESIINQTYKNLEIILIDDGSADKSGIICDKYAKKDARITALHQKNQGAILARKKGLEVANGKYVTFIDSDDFIELDFFEHLMKPIIENKNIDVSIGTYTRYEDGKYIYAFDKYIPIELNTNIARIFMYKRKYYDWSLCAKIYKKELFNNIKISNIYNSNGEDVEINWQILKCCKKIYYQPLFGYNYRNNSESMTQKTFSLARFASLERFYNIFYDDEVLDIELKNIIKYRICLMGSNFIIKYMRLYLDIEPIMKYQNMLKRIFDISQALLTDSEKNYCKYALSDSYNLRAIIKNNNKNVIESYYKMYKKSKNIFIYGAGVIGKEIANILDENNLIYSGFAISTIDKQNNNNKIFLFDDIYKKYNKNFALMLALNEKYTLEVEKKLNENKITNYVKVGKYSFSY